MEGQFGGGEPDRAAEAAAGELTRARQALCSLLPCLSAHLGPCHAIPRLVVRALARPVEPVEEIWHWIRLAQYAVSELPEQPSLTCTSKAMADVGNGILVVLGDRPGAGEAALILAAANYAVSVADTCTEARQLLERRRPALVIVDILLRGHDADDGLSLTLDLLYEGIPALLLCTEPVAGVERLAFLPRAFTPDQLLAAVSTFVTTSQTTPGRES